MLRPPTPRLLPITIVAIGALLVVKSADLVRAALPDPPPTAPAGKAAPASAPSLVPAAHAAAADPAGTAQPGGTAQAAAAAPAAPAPVSDAERAVLMALRERRQELDRRDAAVTAREAVLDAAEHRLEGRVDELQALQKRLESLDAARQQREEAGWQGLVKLYETMKPRDAAAIFNDLDMPVLLQVVDRMKDAKAAPVVASMRVDKARELTDQLAQMRAKRNTLGSDS